MLGDHQFFAKIVPYEPAARIPLIMRFPESMGFPKGQVIDEPVELMDLMPTMLDAAGIDIPDSVDGESLVGLLRGESLDREYIHGECARVPGMGTGMQYLTNGREKYIWLPGQGTEQLFDLAQDPYETRDISDEYVLRDRLELWRKRLAHELEGRPEGFVEEGVLQKLDGPTPYCLPGFECEDSPDSTMHPDDPPPGFDSAPALGGGRRTRIDTKCGFFFIKFGQAMLFGDGWTKNIAVDFDKRMNQMGYWKSRINFARGMSHDRLLKNIPGYWAPIENAKNFLSET
jgi:hypothetical protein